jgi:hypothetical protein
MTLEEHFWMEYSSPTALARSVHLDPRLRRSESPPSAAVHSLQQQQIYPPVDLPILVLAVLGLRKPYAWRTEGHSLSARGLQCGILIYNLVYWVKERCRIERTVFRIVNEEIR